MYPIFKPIDWKHFAPTELRITLSHGSINILSLTGLFKKRLWTHNDLKKISSVTSDARCTSRPLQSGKADDSVAAVADRSQI